MSKNFRIVSSSDIDILTQGAQGNERGRKNRNFHYGDSDLVQRMLNAFEPMSYVQPHKHEAPDKREVFVILRGRLLVLFFSDEGALVDAIVLDKNKEVFLVEIREKVWHTAVGLEKGTVVYEIKDGPYNQMDDKCFASWAPKEGDADSIVYLQDLLKKAKQFVEFE